MSLKGPSHYATMGSVGCRIHTRARLSGRTCDFEFQRPHPTTPAELFGRTFLAIPSFPDHHVLDVRIELSLSFVRCFSIDWNFLIKGVRGECFLVGVALVLDFFLVLFWSYFRGEPGERGELD